MNRQIRLLGAALLFCFAALFVRLNMVQIFGAQRLVEDPLNTRPIVEDFGRDRGDIVTADGVVIATSVLDGSDLERQRVYPQGDLYGHITGWYGFNLGAGGLERVRNDELSGRQNPVPVADLLDLLAPVDVSADVHLSVRHDLQVAARDALGERKGSVVVLNPQTGLVEALWSWPSYDPSAISSNDLASAEQAWLALTADPENPALARSYRELFAPGSTFKVISAAAALDENVLSLSGTPFAPITTYTPPLTTSSIGNFGGATCGGTLLEAFRSSCNTAFAQLGAELLGPQPLQETAEQVGFNEPIPFDLPDGATSRFPTDFGAVVGTSSLDPEVELLENTPGVAQSAIGQFDVRATPLQMALVAAGVATGTSIPEPAVTAEIISDTGNMVMAHEPEPFAPGFSSSAAEDLRLAMVQVVEAGTATNLAIDGLTIGAKTGTAQTTGSGPRNGAEDTHAWVIAFAGPEGQPATHAIAVIVEAVPGGGQQTGGGVAVPIAREVLLALFDGL